MEGLVSNLQKTEKRNTVEPGSTRWASSRAPRPSWWTRLSRENWSVTAPHAGGGGTQNGSQPALRAPPGTYLHPQADCSSPAARCLQLVPEDRLACSWSLFPGGQPRALSSFASTLRWGLNVSCLEHVGSPAGWPLVPGPGTERGVPRKANFQEAQVHGWSLQSHWVRTCGSPWRGQEEGLGLAEHQGPPRTGAEVRGLPRRSSHSKRDT